MLTRLKRVKRSAVCVALTGLLFLCVAGQNRLNAQATATITGTVTDASGAAIGGAAVQVRNTGTGNTQNSNTDAQGRYTVPQLVVGTYQVQASKAGFGTVVHAGIDLTVGAIPVVDFQLAVGQQQQTVTVEGQVSQVETQATAMGALVENKEITDLPLNGRNFTQLLTLAPGVTQIPQGAPGAGNTFMGNGQKYSISGSRPTGQPYLLDDQDMNGFWNNVPGSGGLGTSLGVEAIAEFQTLTNTYSPQFGGNGAVINATSHSGTNSFHGSLYEFLRNDKLESRNFFDNVVEPGKTSASPPTFRQNQFGASVGGPIKKDKAFFFANFEGVRRTQVVSNIVTVPDACVHNAVVSLLPTTAGCALVANASTNPATAQAVANVMALYPLPNYQAETGGGTGTAIVNDPNIGYENYFLARLDYSLTSKDSLFVRYILDHGNRDVDIAGIAYWPEYDQTRDHFAATEWRRIISSNLVNVAHVSFGRNSEAADVYGSPTVSNGVASLGGLQAPAAGTLSPTATSGLSAGVHPLQFFNTTNPSSLLYVNSTAGRGIPREDGVITPGSGLSTVGAAPTLPLYIIPNKFQFGDDIIWTHAAHSITAGVNIKRHRENTWSPFQVGVQWTFPNLAGFVGGNASQANGQVSDVQNPAADATRDYRYWMYETYINDQWKFSNRLTFNIGVRYNPSSMISEVRHLDLNLSSGAPNGSWNPVTTSNAVNPSLKNFDPRVGVAWDVFGDHKTSIRASFGSFHSVIYSRDEDNWLQPPFLTVSQTSQQGLQFPTPYSNIGPSAGLVIPTNGTLSCTNCDYYGVHTTPYQMQWNFNIEREIMANTVASVGYLGSHGRDLWAQRDFNYPVPTLVNGVPTFGTYNATQNVVLPNARLNPAYSYLQMADTMAFSDYNALQAQVNRRFSKGLQYQVSYTLSKSIDDASGTYNGDGGGAIYNPTSIVADKGLSNFNRKHNFRVSGIYNLPYTGKGLLGQIAGGWQLNGVYSYLSGSPFSVGTITNRVFNGSGASGQRPNAVAGCSLYNNVSPEAATTAASGTNSWFNPNCFTPAAVGTYGNAGRDTIIGPNLWDLDTSLQKNWKVTKISEAFTVQFKAEAFNILNHPSFQNPNGTAYNAALSTAVATNPLAGTVLNGSVGKITATNSAPRQIQLALKIIF